MMSMIKRISNANALSQQPGLNLTKSDSQLEGGEHVLEKEIRRERFELPREKKIKRYVPQARSDDDSGAEFSELILDIHYIKGTLIHPPTTTAKNILHNIPETVYETSRLSPEASKIHTGSHMGSHSGFPSKMWEDASVCILGVLFFEIPKYSCAFAVLDHEHFRLKMLYKEKKMINEKNTAKRWDVSKHDRVY
ncbi:hypothetical protein DPMN_160491 [Dreissena polymorpha]|uniref:Uncharacterized protein n=1 Tax=Dreissena polymorpha TaxID=45954 RepID=A0A9D4EKW1_DREPO|nr:hypothetical protein DPMN_160491 [Dreissena polymorpha]